MSSLVMRGCGLPGWAGAAVSATPRQDARMAKRPLWVHLALTTKCSGISFKGEADMRKIVLTGAIIVSCAAFSASPLSINWSATQKSFALSQDGAVAAVGTARDSRIAKSGASYFFMRALSRPPISDAVVDARRRQLSCRLRSCCPCAGASALDLDR